MSALWITIFAFCSLFASLYSMSITDKPTRKFSYGLARVPVLSVFSTTVLAQLFSIFLSKESFEHILSPDHHGSHDASAAHEHEPEEIGGWPYFVGSAASSVALLLSAYALKNQAFQHVLTSATASSLQEHASDISSGICWAIPGLSRLLLPRINSMVLLAGTTTSLLLLCEHFKHDFTWADPVCCLLLSVAVFSTMWPLSTYTGMILLQTTPPHLINQIDRCISEASHIDGVLELKGGRFWQLDFNQLVGTVDVRVRRDADEQNVLLLVTEKFSSLITTLTVQVVKDAAWSAESPAYSNGHSHQDNHGHSHSHSNDHDHDHGHSHGHDGHGHSHDHDEHGHSHSGGSHDQGQNHGHSHDNNDSHGHSHGSSGASHGHSHDGVFYH
uniref:Cation efflux protein transmembrane domain-containing protein n=2 Tax=Caenorhabditis japonica TaxID=281687 RepID=A0A8R1HMI9_CAEJA